MESENPSSFVGRIYKLQCDDGYYYIGSTRTELKCRLYAHKVSSKKYPDRKVYKHINDCGWEKAHILCIEEIPCNKKEELLEVENKYIRESILDPLCLNVNDAILKEEEKKLKQKQYVEQNKDKIDAYHAEYRLKNAEKRREYSKQYAATHHEEVLASNKKYYEENKETILEKQKEYVQANAERIREYKKAYAEQHKDEIREARAAYASENKEKISERGKAYYEANKGILKAKFKEYYEANKEKASEYGKAWRQKMRDTLIETHKCECGGQYSWTHEKRHKESKKHLKFLATAAPAP